MSSSWQLLSWFEPLKKIPLRGVGSEITPGIWSGTVHCRVCSTPVSAYLVTIHMSQRVLSPEVGKYCVISILAPPGPQLRLILCHSVYTISAILKGLPFSMTERKVLMPWLTSNAYITYGLAGWPATQNSSCCNFRWNPLILVKSLSD